MKTLFFYEVKKILQRKIVWICMLISILIILITVSASVLGDYEAYQTERAYEKALSGRLIDDTLLKEMQEAYAKVPLDQEKYSHTDEYQTYARPYSTIFNTVRRLTGLVTKEVLTELDNEKDIYRVRMQYLERDWNALLLSEKEKAFWREQEEQRESPMTFRYAEGYNMLMMHANTIGLLCIFMVSVYLANVYTEEHIRKTDQLILSSKYGRGHTFLSKYLAGMFVAGMISLIFILFTFGVEFFIYGAEGFEVPLQLVYGQSSCQISVGQAVLILYSMILLASLFEGVFVMMLSEVLHSSVGTLSVAIGIIILTMMISVPEEYRLLAQMWNFLPSNV
ncbi:MAG: ABC transporter permease subunit, partial [Agathobacter sp.]|nr:ABC transporter permease subunit [Agathobacter sp.]